MSQIFYKKLLVCIQRGHKPVALVICLFFPCYLYAVEPLQISLGDNYGKHAMFVDGKPAGIQKDILDWFLKEYMELDVEIEAMPWKRAQALVEKINQSDGYFTAYTKARVEDLNLVVSKRPFYITNVKIHTWKGNPKIEVLKKLNSIDELLRLDDIKHAFLGGSGYHEEQFKNAKVKYKLNSIHQIAKFVLEYKRADIFVEQSELFYPVAEELGLVDEIESLDNIQFKSLYWHLYIRNNSKHVGLMHEVDKALDKAIEDGQLLRKVREIFLRYGLPYSQ